jgi:hypothetical protein
MAHRVLEVDEFRGCPSRTDRDLAPGDRPGLATPRVEDDGIHQRRRALAALRGGHREVHLHPDVCGDLVSQRNGAMTACAHQPGLSQSAEPPLTYQAGDRTFGGQA